LMVAAATINAYRASAGQPRQSVAELVAAGAISYIAFPPALAGKYQSFTEADLSRLRQFRSGSNPHRKRWLRMPECQSTEAM